jgi:arylsulfatase A-like enzyme
MDGPEGEYLTDRLTDESIRFIEANPDRPFLLFLSFYTVHTPIQACERHLERFETKAAHLPNQGNPAYIQEHEGFTLVNQVRPDYASMVYAMDENVGRLLQKLKETGLEENTVIIFTSDNGGLSTLPENRNPPTSVKPLRAGKGWCYEGGIRVPLIIKAPGTTSPGSITDVPVISHDFYPTMLSLAGFSPMPEQHQDGLNLLPLLQGKTSLEREALIWHYPHYHGSTWTPGAAIRMGDWKLIEFYDYGKTELYNLRNDPGEQTDLSAQEPERVKVLKEKLVEMQKETGSKRPLPNDL